jgi:hypothetical protein
MVSEINTLASALIKNEKKLAKLKEDGSRKLKEAKRIMKNQNNEGRTLDSEN